MFLHDSFLPILGADGVVPMCGIIGWERKPVPLPGVFSAQTELSSPAFASLACQVIPVTLSEISACFEHPSLAGAGLACFSPGPWPTGRKQPAVLPHWGPVEPATLCHATLSRAVPCRAACP